MQCLLVDDDLDDQEIFLMTLEKIDRNIKCVTADNGVEALLLLTERHKFVPDYIFLDVNMPKIDGIECLKNIKLLDHMKNCRIFMYSTTSETSAVEKAKALGATDFIVKPVSPSLLKDILSSIFCN